MQVKKLFTLLAFLGIAASASAQVTFSYDDGQNDNSWGDGTAARNVTSDVANQVWRANPGDVSDTDAGKGSYVILKAVNASSEVVSTHIQGYTIKLGPIVQSQTGMPTTWKLEGSNNKTEWNLIHKQDEANRVKEYFGTGSSLTSDISRVFTYYCNTTTAYKYFRLIVTGKTGGAWGCFEMAKFDLIPSNVGFSPSSPNNGMDGKTGTMLSGNVSSSPQTLSITGTGNARMTGFQFTTGSDNETNTGRNPKNIKVEGSDNNSTWNIIEYKTGYTGLEDKNYYPYVFQCYGTKDYQYYRFSFDNVDDASDNFQMSELAIITESCSTHSYSSEGFCEKCLSPKAPTKDGSTYQISNAGEFVKFAEIVNSGTKTDADGKLTADIDLTNVSWTPIGTDTNKYHGKFDGSDNSVTLAISTTESNQGLFGYAKDGAQISNLVVKGTINCGASSAALIGQAGGDGLSGTITISRVGCEANVTGGTSDDRIGAFVGNDWGYTTVLNIKNSYNIGDIKGSTDQDHGWTSVVGCHTATGSTFKNVYNKGTISSNKFFNDNRGTCYNCYTTTSGNGTTEELTQNVNSDQVTSGELCAKLGYAFRQNKGSGYPCFDKTKGFVTKIGSARYSTQYITESDVTIPDDIEAFTGVFNGSEWLRLVPVSTTIAAEEPVILRGNSGLYNFMPTTGGSKVVDNVLKGSDGSITATAGDNFYALAKKDDVVGFYPVDEGVTIPAGKAYIDLDDAPAVKGFTFIFDEDATSINEELRMKNEESEASIFNLAGQRINKMQKGINIVNGRKVLF